MILNSAAGRYIPGKYAMDITGIRTPIDWIIYTWRLRLENVLECDMAFDPLGGSVWSSLDGCALAWGIRCSAGGIR